MYQSICNEIMQAGISAEIVETVKGGIRKTGITMGDGNIRPTLYPDDFSGNTAKEKAEKMISVYNNAPELTVNTDDLTSWEYAKTRLYKCLRPVIETDDQITRPVLDLDMYIRLRIDNEKSVVVTRGLLKSWGITEDELFNTAQIENGIVNTMTTVFNNAEPESLNIEKVGLLIISNTHKLHGASVILDNAFLDKIAQENGGSFYIIPSSIHECLCIKGIDLQDLKKMVESVNSTEVKPEERLSNTVYKYENGHLEIAA